MGLIDIFGWMFLGGAAISNSIEKQSRTLNDIEKTKQNGDKCYVDYTGSRIVDRSLETDEIVQFRINCGHRQKVGIKTGKIYQDFTQEKIDKENEELRLAGKLFHYESTKNMRRWLVNGNAVKVKVENLTGMAFETKKYSLSNGRVIYKMYYLDTENRIPSSNISDHGKEISESEYKLYSINDYDNLAYRPLN